MLWLTLLASLQAESLIERLGSDDIAVREDASMRLKVAGSSARPALIQALESSDAEVRARARAVLDWITRITRIWTLTNADPAEVAGVIRTLFKEDPPELTIDLRTRSLILRGRAGDLETVDTAVKALDQPAVETVTYVVRTCGDAKTLGRILEDLLRRGPKSN